MAAQVDTLLEMYTGLNTRVSELDEVLNAALDQKSAGRRAVINSLVSAVQETVDGVVNQLVSQLGNADDSVKFGVFYGVLRGLRENFEDKAQAFADSKVEERPTVSVDPTEVENANKERSDKVGQMKHLAAIIAAVDPEVGETLTVPRRRPGGGPRGKREITYYGFTLDGEAFEGSLTDLAKKLGYEKSVTLREEMRAAGINLTLPPLEFEFETSGGNKITAVRSADAPPREETDESVEDSDDDSDDEDEIDEDEETETE